MIMNNKILITSIVSTLILIPLTFLVYKKRKAKKELKKRILADGNPDYKDTAKNIALSISKSKQLYKELITKVHPDIFLDNRKERATELSSRITKSRRNYDELITLEIEVKEFLEKQ